MTISIHSLRTVTESNERLDTSPIIMGEDYVMQHTKALLLMDKYQIQDFYSLAFITMLAIFACIFLTLIMVEHSCVSPSSPIYITPTERWRQILPWNYSHTDSSAKIPNMPDFDY